MKRKKQSPTKPPKRLLPHITPDELQTVNECEAMDRIEAEAEKEKLERRYRSENFDPRTAIKAYLSEDDPERGFLLVSLVAACVPTNAALDVAESMMKGLKPRNFLELLLLSQMAACHMEGLKQLTRAANTKDQDYCDRYTNRAARLMRVFLAQLEALESLRNRGGKKQRIVVQHVHVSADKALVGVQGAGA